MSGKYELIDAEKANHAIARMCAWLRVPRSGFYDWRSRPLSATAERRERLKLMIEAVFDANHETYGYRRIHAVPARSGEEVAPDLVRQLMRELGLVPVQPRPWRPVTTVAGEPGAIGDLVNRDFTAMRPDAKLVGDITYIPTWEGFLYLATMIDCHSKMVSGGRWPITSRPCSSPPLWTRRPGTSTSRRAAYFTATAGRTTPATSSAGT